MSKGPKLPKGKCCVSKKRCGRCPIRMLSEGTLPPGYGVKKRRLVRIDPDAPALVPATGKKKAKQQKRKKQKQAKKVAAQARLGDAA